ncbi:hypothetical protein D9M72_470770 [compost metagenome]
MFVATSVNGDTAGGVNAGLPARRYMNAAMASRFTAWTGPYVLVPSGSVQPVVMPVDANQVISL